MNNKVNSPLVTRELFPEIASHVLKSKEISLITGSRQVGKSVLLKQIQDHIVAEKNISADQILSFNLDIVQDYETLHDQQSFIEYLRDRSRSRKLYVFVDEAQKVPDAASYFKGVYDSALNIKLILTGSSALEVKAHMKESLAGRKRIFWLPTFTFFECLSLWDPRLAKIINGQTRLGTIEARHALLLYQEYVRFGGYPRVVIADGATEKRALLREIYGSYVERDAVGLLEVSNRTAFTRLIKLLASQIGQLVNIDELAMHLAINRGSVERYLRILEDTFVSQVIRPFFRNPRQEIIKAGKVFFLDTGIRNLALENLQTWSERVDRGPLLENSVFSDLKFALRDGATLHFWRTKQKSEVDFVIEHGSQLIPIEVKSALKKPAVPEPLRTFIAKFKPRDCVIISPSFTHKIIEVNAAKVHFLYPFELRHFLKNTLLE